MALTNRPEHSVGQDGRAEVEQIFGDEFAGLGVM